MRDAGSSLKTFGAVAFTLPWITNAAEAKRLFKGRLAAARKIIAEKDARAASELALLQQDRAIHPAPSTNHRGEPRWDQSAAQALLKQDVAAKKYETMSHVAFYQSRPEYQAYPKSVIMGHVAQEVRLKLFENQYRGRYGY